MKSHNLDSNVETNIIIPSPKNPKINHTIVLLWFIFWMVMYFISIVIQPELILLPMLLNLPLATFFCLGIIIETLVIYIFNIEPSFDLIGKLLVFLFTYLLNFIYRGYIYREIKPLKRKIISRIKEFFIWIIPWLIMMFILSKLTIEIQ